MEHYYKKSVYRWSVACMYALIGKSSRSITNTDLLHRSKSAIMKIKTRRGHTKSRNGCVLCKSSRRKCDEVKPVCGSCKARNQLCEYRPTSQSGATKYRFVDQSVGSSGPAEKPSLTYQDLEIWHHYVANVVSWFDDGQEFWIHRIPSVGFKNKLVLHLVLSFSALHMARTGSSRTSELLLDAEKHNSIGLRGLIDLLADLQGDNYEVAMLASMLVSFCYFGKGPVEGEYLLFNEKGPGEWIVLLRGARSVIEAVNETGKDAKVNEKPNTSSRSLDYEPHTANLRSFVQTEVANGKTSSTTLDALDLLLKFYGSIYGNKPSDPSFSFALGWPYRLSPEYVDSVAGKNSTALLVFAHFTLLLNDLKSQWFMQGWANHVLCGIRKHIGQDYLNWLDWIQNQISP